MMTRKDYELIAGVFRYEIEAEPHDGRRDAVIDTAERMAVELKADNPRFDSNRFLKACGAR